MQETGTAIGLRERLLVDAKTGLSYFRDSIDPLLAEYIGEAVGEARKEDVLIADAVERAGEIILSGGKRLRAGLMCAGYFSAGGDDEERILRASMSIEFTHAFMLTHDDIIDRDALRHGVETVHAFYARQAASIFPGKDAEHFGNSVGIIVGDMVAAFGNDVIFRSGFPHERVFTALSELQRIVSYTVIGQGMDIALEYRRDPTREDIVKMYEYKTAKYSVEGPLVLGALLAGAPESAVVSLKTVARPLGIAFQVRDDILGIFGTKEKLGKPVGSDMAEGKRTILVLSALDAADRKQRAEIETLLSTAEPSEADVARFRELLRETGALDSSSEYMIELVEEAKREIRKAGFPDDVERFLLSVSEYVAERAF